jgi:hypothetical protein
MIRNVECAHEGVHMHTVRFDFDSEWTLFLCKDCAKELDELYIRVFDDMSPELKRLLSVYLEKRRLLRDM